MSTRSKPEAVQVVKKRRDAALRALVDGVPYISFLGIEFDRRGDELTGVLPFSDKLIGNPLLQAPNLLITPHLAWATVEARKRLMQMTADNVQAFQDGAPINVVN